MKKNVISSILAATMALSLSAPAFAAEPIPTEAQIQAEIEARQEEVFADVYAQLEEQDGLAMYDNYVEILGPRIEAEVLAQYETTATVSSRSTKTYAPNGGALSYRQTGGVEVQETYMNSADVVKFVAKKEADTSKKCGIAEWVEIVFDAAAEVIISQIATQKVEQAAYTVAWNSMKKVFYLYSSVPSVYKGDNPPCAYDLAMYDPVEAVSTRVICRWQEAPYVYIPDVNVHDVVWEAA